MDNKTKNHKHKKSRGFFLRILYNKKGIWFHLAGIAAIIWFIIRVVPRPDRLRYPCQQIGISVAFGYIAFWSIIWTALFHGMALWIKQLKIKTSVFAPVILVCFVMIFSVSSNVFAENYVIKSYDEEVIIPWDPIPNEPIGTPSGYKPGRVVWGWNPDATEKEQTGQWWKKENNDQEVIDQLFASCVKKLADVDDEFTAWDLLFKYFNVEHGHGEVGYQAGEKIAIKINFNNCGSYTEEDNHLDASPYVIKALLRQLVNIVNVAQEDITIYDASRRIPNWFYNRVYYEEFPADPLIPEFADIHYVDGFGGASGREKVIASNEFVHFAGGTCAYRTLPTCVINADYLINMPLLKRHPIKTGVTLSGKNFFGTWMEDVYPVHPYHEDSFIPGYPAPQTDLFAHADIGGKVVLYIGDGLYATCIDHRTLGKFQMYPFNNDWTNSLYFSQDPVAIDSVMFDFLHTEGTNPVEGSQFYLHQSAIPNENTYDPENDGTFLSESLGVHEHWNKDEDIFSSERYVGPSENGIDYISFIGGEFEADANGPYYGLVNVPVEFHGFAFNGVPPYSWHWLFGDGETSDEQNPTHTYTSARNFSVVLTVIDNESENVEDITWALIYDQFPPDPPIINGPKKGKVGEEQTYCIPSIVDPEGDEMLVLWDWDDGTITDWQGPYASGEKVCDSHTWNEKGDYIIKAKLKDEHGAESEWGILEVSMPRTKLSNNLPLLVLFERFKSMFPIIRLLL